MHLQKILDYYLKHYNSIEIRSMQKCKMTDGDLKFKGIEDVLCTKGETIVGTMIAKKWF